jgi:hypothetical protein
MKEPDFPEFYDLPPGTIINGRFVKLENREDYPFADCVVDIRSGKIIHFTKIPKIEEEEKKK